jgi:hypothetical protein
MKADMLYFAPFIAEDIAILTPNGNWVSSKIQGSVTIGIKPSLIALCN